MNLADNIYFKNNPEYFQFVKNLVDKYPNNYGFFVKHDKILLNWINRQTPLLQDKFFELKTKIFWILNGLSDFPKCLNCQSNEKFKHVNVDSLFLGYKKFCSKKCANSSVIVLEKIKQTSLKKYGCERPSQSAIVKKHAIENCMKKYGVANTSQLKSAKEKARKTCLEKYGAESPLQAKTIKEKIKQTNLKLYGAENVFSSNIVKETIKQTNIKNFGSENPSQAYCIKEQKRQTCLKRYGVDNPMQYAEFRKKSAQQYTFKNINFDSGPELAYYIWLSDNKIKFEYQPNKAFEYEFQGKKHVYLPDFLVDGQYVELKGKQFLNENGTWRCPYDRSQDGQIEAKRQCLLKNNVVILYEADYLQYVKYVENKYGKDFLKSFKNTKNV